MPNSNHGGRPPKFNEPSRPVTLTLPESTLQQLELIDPDRAQAIVKLTRNAFPESPENSMVKIIPLNRNLGLLIVGASTVLKKIPFLHLVEVALGRYLIAIDEDHDFRSLELALHDLIEEEDMSASNRIMVQSLLDHVSTLRKTDQVSHASILIVNIRS